ncbi:hypothetical protein, partial [Sulfuracidifex metallicus]|uniref:hypothetical protein n=1 Tax=Sulfuracidifex metallicus TaxID=47303 RepID=UPI002276E137
QVKKLMNSSYGKWGMHKRRSHVEERPSIASLIRKVGGHKKIGDVVYTKLGESLVSYQEVTEPIYSLPIASFVTAFARTHIHSLAERVGYENVYYMDTDSLFLNEDAYNEAKRLGLTDEVVLGKMKLEKEGFFKIYGKKFYIQVKDGMDKKEFTTQDILQKNIIPTIKGVSKNPKTLKFFKMDSKTGELQVRQVQSSYYNREIQFRLVEKIQSPKPRLRYQKEGKHEIGYALSQ